MKKVLLITEYLNPPFDEGIKKTALNIFKELDKRYQLMVVCRYGFEKDNILILDSNKLFVSRKLKSEIFKFDPDVMIYLPFQSSTFASYIRLNILKSYTTSCKTILMALQPKPISFWESKIINFIKPEIGLTPSPSLKFFWDHLGINNRMIPLLTDTSIFTPLNDDISKNDLRKKYNLPIDSLIISHMGHLNEGRNLRSLIQLQEDGFQVVIVGSSSTPNDALGKDSLKNELIDSNIIVMDGYIDHIEEIYQLSDVYIFPVIKENSSIGMPLSILEARACAIPVITTNYGSIKKYMGDDSNGLFYSTPDKFAESANRLKELLPNSFNSTMVESLNNQFFQIIIDQIES